MPFLRRLIERDGSEVRSLYSGLPSSTPAFQAELFYGEAGVVPSFCFYDPIVKRVLSLNEPAAACIIEGRLKVRSSGLLRGGSAWSNIFSGGAMESQLCASTVGLRRALMGLSPRRLVILGVWHIWSVFRAAGHLLLVIALAFWDLFRGALSRREFLLEVKFLPLRVLVGVVMREIVVAGASIDLLRGLPIVQLNLLGYDEHAHRRGPDSRFVLWSLRGIDHSIRRVWQASQRSRPRDYQLWIYSDHGQERVVTFEKRHGETVGTMVRRVHASLVEERDRASALAERTAADSGPADTNVPPLRSPLYHDPTPSHVERRSRRRGKPVETARDPTIDRSRWLGSKTVDRQFVARLERGEGASKAAPTPPAESPEPDVSRPKQIVVTHQGPTGAVYLPEPPDDAFLHTFAERLVQGGIPMVLRAREAGVADAYTPDGLFQIPAQAEAVLGADHPHLHAVADDLAILPHHPGAGDLMLFGWNRAEPMSLQNEVGSHGGPGPNETSAFVLVPREAHAFTALPTFSRPRTLRAALLRVRERPVSGRRHHDETKPEYAAPRLVPSEQGLQVALRVMTYNVHGCRGMDGIFAPHRIARVIARERPDVICLQELDRVRTRSGGVDQVHRIAQRLQREYLFHAVSELGDGHFGNAILSSLPMRLIRAGGLPSATRAKQMLSLWDRGALHVALVVEGHEVHVINTHLSVFPAERTLQAEALIGPDWIGEASKNFPLILAGDFNASPASRTMTRFVNHLRSVAEASENARELRTWTGNVPLRRIDHVLVNDAVQVRGVYVPRSPLARVASDHMPLVTDLLCGFRLAEPTPVKEATLEG